MIAFIKRRWVSLSCALGLLGCSVIEFGTTPIITSGGMNLTGLYTSWGNLYFYGGDGRAIVVESLNDNIAEKARFPNETRARFNVPPQPRIHAPAVGSVPKVVLKGCIFAKVPIWLLLATVIGWIVFREVRSRKKFAVDAAASLAQP